MSETSKTFGIVLGAGGARAAYQVGALKAIADHCPHFTPKIFCGTSAGSINSTFLAQGETLQVTAPALHNLWSNLTYDSVFKTNFNSLMSMTLNIVNDLTISKFTKKLRFKSVLDAAPLGKTLKDGLPFAKVHSAIKEGKTLGVAVTLTSYLDGKTFIIYDSYKDVPAWNREHRTTISSQIKIRHIMASCSIPIIFEPVRIADGLFGDGSLNFRYPFSPAIHLGANHVLAIGIQGPPPEPAPFPADSKVDLGMIAGTVLDSIFLDNLRPDFLNVCRINEMGKDNPNVKKVYPLLLRPSVDPGQLAKDFTAKLPFHFRQAVKTFTNNPEESGALMSYVMFNKDYIHAMMNLGEKDTLERMDEIIAWVGN